MIVKALAVRASNQGQVRKATTATTFRSEGGKIFLTYELFGSAILRFTRRSTERKDLCVNDSAPSQLNSGINKVPEVTGSLKSFFGRSARYIKFQVT